MPEINLSKMMAFATSGDLRQWFELNHASETELWVKIFKINSGVESVSWDDVVIESLCWGWIDGIKKSIDEQAYCQRITPRKARSVWSKRNREHVERLIDEQRMTEFGLAHVEAAKQDGRWDNAYAVSEMKVPDDFLLALESNAKAKQFFETLTKSNLYSIAHALNSAKKAETRERRFAKYMQILVNQQKP
ncbi:YdeI/OmpD-associated family protein [Neptunicella marina]|uniref:YdeI/OmpD-associated family protein n=1 Tax=Neptunicella marina TaxID=2125989 RepID=A0A8J6ISP8_9ALTE|nr:YdeI/OmpD-associated family protein [Neptunicella marina]MBC3765599.1 YdeI/OmpD-associated family protein [Neptunicella marina]